MDEVGWYIDNCEDGKEPAKVGYAKPNRAHNIGEKHPNDLGLYDMSGNAPEWCYDWYGEYSDELQTNPTGGEMPEKKKERYRVIRGGGWYSAEDGCRVTDRSKGHPEEDTASFRVVRSVLPRDAAK